jgi:SAM-dependent methyltransferase
MVFLPWYSAVLLIGAGFATYFVFGSFLAGAGYQPAPDRVIRRMLEFARVTPEDRVYDLGAGTGGLLFRAVEEYGASGVGVEVEPLRYLYLRYRRRRSRARSRVQILRQNLFEVDLSSANVILAFLWPGAMRRLRQKFSAELRPGTRVVSYYHRIAGWVPVEKDEHLRVYYYTIPPTLEVPSAEPFGATPVPVSLDPPPLSPTSKP